MNAKEYTMTSLSSLDDLMVDSLQLSCAVSQTRRDHSSQLLQDTLKEAQKFLSQISAISPHEQFQIFLYSKICSRRLETFLNTREEVMLID